MSHLSLYRLYVALPFFLLPCIGDAQGNGRLEEVKRTAVGLVETARDGRQFDHAAAKLEEIWDQDQSDPSIAEALAIAYLNGEDRRYNPAVEAKATGLMEKSLAAHGSATFLVKHSHEHLKLTGRTITRYCAGKLSIRGGRLIYIATTTGSEPAHSFDLAPADFQMSEANSHDGMVQIKFRAEGKAVTFSLVPRDGNALDGTLLRELARKSLGIQ